MGQGAAQGAQLHPTVLLQSVEGVGGGGGGGGRGPGGGGGGWAGGGGGGGWGGGEEGGMVVVVCVSGWVGGRVQEQHCGRTEQLLSR